MIFHQPWNSVSAKNYNSRIYSDDIWDYHFHKNFEVIYVIKGNVFCSINSIEKLLSVGQFGMCLPNEIHSYRPQKGSLYWVGVFSADYVRSFANSVEGMCGDDFVFSCSESVTEFLKANLITEEVPNQFLLKACLYGLCAEYCKTVNFSEKDKNKTRNIEIITDFVAQHHTENISLSDIAKLLGYDYNYVSRYFKTVFNMSFKEFLTIHRLETALKLMEEGNKKIVDIAYESGFQSVRTFNECFKQHFNMNPSEYRKTSN